VHTLYCMPPDSVSGYASPLWRSPSMRRRRLASTFGPNQRNQFSRCNLHTRHARLNGECSRLLNDDSAIDSVYNSG
jgi:hypothetical protein